MTILVPCFNEHGTILAVLTQVARLPIDKVIIVVDNHSTDGTRELLLSRCLKEQPAGVDWRSLVGIWYQEGQQILQADGFWLVLQPKNSSKGTSVKTGLALANSEYFVCQDADLEYEPQDIPKLLSHAEETRASAVFGSRLLRSAPHRKDIYHSGRVALTKLFCLLYATRLTDVATCYKLMQTDVARRLDMRASGFDLDFEIPAKLSRLGCRIEEIPIHYFPRDAASGKKLSWVHGASAVRTLLRYRLWVADPVASGAGKA